MAAMLVGLIYPQTSFGKGFTSADLLKWKVASQDSFFQTSIGMTGVIASQNRREAARCIDQWYFSDKAIQQRRNDHIRNTMKKFPNYDPQATIFAIVRKACGKLF